MYDINQITVPDLKMSISRSILEALEDWFGIPESREAYIKDSAGQPFWCAYDGDLPVGFIVLKESGKDTVELCVMGVLEKYHRKGAGRALFDAAYAYSKANGYSFMQVKTVKMGMYEEYDRTNLFYRSLGFKEFEVFPELWDESNPCQVYVMTVK